MAEPFVFDCDARGGHFTKLQTVAAGTDHILQGNVAARQLYKEGEWLPTALISLTSADRKQQVAIRILADIPDKDEQREGAIFFATRHVIDGKGEDGETFASIPVGTSVPFSVSATGNDGVIKIGDMEKRFAFAPGDKPVAMVACSTGEFVFTELEMSAG